MVFKFKKFLKRVLIPAPIHAIVKGKPPTPQVILTEEIETIAKSTDSKSVKVVADAINNHIEATAPSTIQDFFEAKNLRVGDHLYIIRINIYSHHGLYIGDNQVIHFDKSIHIVSLGDFAMWKGPQLPTNKVRRKSIQESPAKYSPEEIVARAKSRLNEANYNLIFNNFEGFVRWCRNGD